MKTRSIAVAMGLLAASAASGHAQAVESRDPLARALSAAHERGLALASAEAGQAAAAQARGRADQARAAEAAKAERAEAEQARAEEEARRASARSDRQDDRDARAYQRGVRALDERQWDEAVRIFTELAAATIARADGALYWKAYALNRLGQRAEALSALTDLRNGFPKSRWTNDARALELEIRQTAGQRVGAEPEADDDLRLLALQGLATSDPEQALPMLEKLLHGTQSPKLKDRALFVLAQSRSPRAQEILTSIARGTANPDLQSRAIHYLGIHGGRENRQLLGELYAASNDLGVKREILRSFLVSGARDQLLAAARSEAAPELRAEAVRQLGAMGASDELWQLYGRETSRDVKTRIIQAMFQGGHADRLIELAKTEKDPDLRRTAVRNLGVMGSSRTGEALVAIYAADTDPAIRRAAIQGLFVQNNARALVDLARKESDPATKREIVRSLSLMKSKEATDYLLEILKD